MNEEKYKPIMIFGIILIVFGLLGLLLAFDLSNDASFGEHFTVVAIIISIYHFIPGIGVVLKKEWGLKLFKIYLYILMVAFPIGTYISIRTRKYMRENGLLPPQ